MRATAVNGSEITFSYTAGGTGYNALSAIVTDSAGALKYYGRLENNPLSGSATVEVPTGLDPTDELLVFIEQANPDAANMTDFASQPVPLTRAAPTGLDVVAPTTYGGTDGKITGTTADMEYSSDNGTTWTDCTASPTTGLAAGSYQVRYMAQTVGGIEAVTASPTASVTIGEGAPFAPTVASIAAPAAVDVGGTLTLTTPAVTWNGNTGTEGWEISADGSTWAVFNPATTMTAAHNGQQLRYTATNSADTGYSNIVAITINNAPTLALPANNSVMPPSGTISAGKDFTFSATGDRQSVATGTTVGDTRYLPASWSINPSGTFPIGGPYTATTRIDSAGSHTLTVTYQLQRWTGTAWENVIGSTDQKSVTLNVQAASSSTPAASSSAAAGGSPQTGDSSSMGLWVALLILSLLAVAAGAMMLYKRRKAS